jgi:hypothetical protein
MKNTSYNTLDVKKCCEKKSKLNISFKAGKEYNGWFIKDEKKICRVTVPRGRKKIGPFLYGSMAKQLKLTTRQFDDLLDCPLKKHGYERILNKQGLI